jgi:ketosteroid isomerase-like protein
VPGGEEVVRRAYDALQRRDLVALEELADPDLEMDLSERVLNPATYRGGEGLLRFLGEVDELWASMDIAVEHVIEHGDELLAVLMVTLKGRGSGVEMESRIAQRWTLREGRLLRMKLQPDADAAVAQFEARDTGAH